MPRGKIWSWYTGRWWVGCYIWYSEEGTGRGRSPPRPLLDVPNLTVHPSTASVPITVLLYNGPLLCGFNVPIKGLKCCTTRDRYAAVIPERGASNLAASAWADPGIDLFSLVSVFQRSPCAPVLSTKLYSNQSVNQYQSINQYAFSARANQGAYWQR